MEDKEDLSRLRIRKTETKTVRRRRRGVLFWLVLVTLLAAAAWGAFVALNPLSRTVTTAAVGRLYPSQTLTRLNASGYVVAQRRAAVASKVTARLVWLGVEEGSTVRTGEIIARLEAEDVEAQRGQAQARLSAARAAIEDARADLRDAELNFGRQKELLDKGLTARADFDTAQARFLRAQARLSSTSADAQAAAAALKAADVSVEYTLIRAPFDGKVLTKNADIGDIVTPLGAAANAKASVVTIADMSSLQVEADVSESNLAKVELHQPCEISLDALPETRFEGQVHMIVPTADRTKASVLVKVRFLRPDPRILPEMSAKVAFLERPVTEAEREPRIVVPPSAVVRSGDSTFVFAVRDGRAVLLPVRLGDPLGDMVTVLEGVGPGEKVVTAPPDGLKAGDKVKTPEA